MKNLVIVISVIINYSVYSFDYRHDRNITRDDIVTLLQHPETERFLTGFNSSYQRWVLTKQLEHCPRIPLCSFSSAFALAPLGGCCKNCDCDFPDCMQKRTCCPDIIFQNIDMSNDTIITEDDLKLLTGNDTHKTCLPLYVSKGDVVEIKQSAFGYASCPLETSKALKRNCTVEYSTDMNSIADMIPVIKKASNDLYRNKYCAYCHNVTDDEFQQLGNRLLCKTVTRLSSQKSIINEVLTKNVCGIEFVSDRRLDGCLSAVSKCNTTGLWAVSNPQVESSCALYRSVIGKNKGIRSFQNVFCSECNGIYQTDLHCDILSGNQGSNDFAFSGLLKLDRQDSTDNQNPSSDSCSENQFYDKISETCKALFCPVNMDLSHGKCVDMFEKLGNMLYLTFVRITPMHGMSLYESFADADAIFHYTSSWFSTFGQICNIQMMFQSNIGIYENYIKRIENSSILFYDMRIQFFVDRFHEPNDFMGLIIKPHNFSLFQHGTSFEFRVTDGDPKAFDITAILSDTTSLSDALNVKSQETSDSLMITNLVSNYSFSGYQNHIAFPYIKGINDIQCTDKKTPFNILWLQSCPKVNISKDEFHWVKTTNGVIIKPGDYILNSEEFYFPDENHIMVCVESFKELLANIPSSSTSSLSVSTIISVVCSSLSVFSLVVTFVIFSSLPQLRQSIPGKNNMSLVLFLLIAQCLYMVSGLGGLDTNSSECLLLGILVHFFWLLAIFWMNACTFHVFRVLAKTKVISRNSGRKRFMMYHFYAVVMAAGFVSVNVIVSYYLSGDIGYGGQTCYISSQQMVNYTFVIPVAFVVISNISMFLFLIIRIRNISSVQKNVQHERNDFNIFAKLSTITGVTWIFGLLYTWSSVIVLSYLFIILNACQGVFIMFSFIINRRVLHLLKTKTQSVTSTGSLGTASSAFSSRL